MTLIEKLEDLHRQATTERSHYYVAGCVREAIEELRRLEPARRIALEYQEHVDAVVGLASQHGCNTGSFQERLGFLRDKLKSKSP